DLLATGEEFAKVLTKLTDIPVRVTVASDYAAVIEALRNRTADLAFVHPVGYVLASREAKALIVVRNLWHGKSSFTSRIYVRKESGLKSLEELRGRTMAFIDPASSSGYTYPMVLLIQRGLVKNRDPKTFFREVVFAGSHDAGMRALLNGHVAARSAFDRADRVRLLSDDRGRGAARGPAALDGCARRGRSRCRARRARRRPRSQRRRQDHVPALAEPSRRAHRRDDPRGRPGGHRRRGRRGAGRSAPHRHGLPAVQPGPARVRDRARPGGAARLRG